MPDKFQNYDSQDSVYHAPLKSDDGEIKSYDLGAQIYYPCVCLDAQVNPPAYKIQVLANTLEKLEFNHCKVLEGYYDVVLIMGNQKMVLGMVQSDNLRALLQGDIFSDFKKTLRLSETEIIEGDMMLAYCTSPLY